MKIKFETIIISTEVCNSTFFLKEMYEFLINKVKQIKT